MISLKTDVFQKLLKKRGGIKERTLLLKVADNQKNQIRLGILIPKKICKKAVLRNKIKRRIKEILRKRETKLKRGKDLLFIALPGITQQQFSDMEKMIERMIFKSKILKQ